MSEQHGKRQGPEASRMQGHWLLASLGKRVLRPGGIALTKQMLSHVGLQRGEKIVEFGPGVGRTAELLLASEPSHYWGVDPNPEGKAQVEKVLSGKPQAEYLVADAAATGLPDASVNVVIGEAMLTIQPDAVKDAIVGEAARLLSPGGRYGIHEIMLRDGFTKEELETAQKELSRAIKVGARPLPVEEWRALFARHGLEVEWVGNAPLRLLEPSRLIADEGLLGALRFWRNARNRDGASERLRIMRNAMRVQSKYMCAVGIVARKKL
ncbi:class I SAM-dependent methyltransferase [Dermabacteraceae bacterium P7074]